MGLRDNWRTTKRLQAAAQRVEDYPPVLDDLDASELMSLLYLFDRFKHRNALVYVAETFYERLDGDPAFKAAAEADAEAHKGVKMNDWKAAQVPSALSAFEKVGV